MMAGSAGLTVYSGRVLPEWIDYNGHMNIAFYVMAFSRAVDAMLDLLGMDAAYRHDMKRSVFTTEAHICYLHEMREAEALEVTLKLLGYDDKRLHAFFSLYKSDAGLLAATSEHMFLHVDTTQRKVASFDDAVRREIERLWQDVPVGEIPAQAGRSIMTLANTRV